MSLDKIQLRKLLKLMYLPKNELISALRDDIRSDIKKANGPVSGGGDFHLPFWADAKGHVAGTFDLRKRVEERVGSNFRRGRLYPKMAEGFLRWWEEKRRWKNEKFSRIPQRILGQHVVPNSGVIVVDNLLPLAVGDDYERIIYPYFSEDPALSEEAGRIGLWVLSKSLVTHKLADFRLLDLLRGRAFSTDLEPLRGNEESLLVTGYERVTQEWHRLRKEYP